MTWLSLMNIFIVRTQTKPNLMNTTIAKHLLCLLLIMLFIGSHAQEQLAMNSSHFPDNESKVKSDTLDNLKLARIKSSAVKKFKVIPSQSSFSIHVLAKNIEEGAYIFEIYNLSGERVYNEVSQLSRTHYKIINTSFLPEGSYYLIIKSRKISFKAKISI